MSWQSWDAGRPPQAGHPGAAHSLPPAWAWPPDRGDSDPISKPSHSLIVVLLHTDLKGCCCPTSNTEEAEVERFYEDLQDLLELTPQKDVLFIIGNWNAKVGSQETPGVTGKFGFGIRNEAGQRLIEFCQENTLVIANTLLQQHKRRLYT